MKIPLMGVYFDDYTLDEFVTSALKCIQNAKPCTVVTPNAEIAMECRKNSAFRDIVNNNTLCLPDGVSIKMAAKIVGAPITRKAAGVDFCENMCCELALLGKSVFLFGAKPGVAELAAEKLTEKYPGLKIAGCRNGYFTEAEEDEIVDCISNAAPAMLIVCLGAPKQELFIDKYKDRIPPCVMIGAGGAIDVFAGTVKRAPKVFIKLGLEWLYRLLKEPRRIKRMIKLPMYLVHAFMWRLRGEKENA